MKTRASLLALALLTIASGTALAGFNGKGSVPALGDLGLVLLGLGLVGGGVAALRRRRS